MEDDLTKPNRHADDAPASAASDATKAEDGPAGASRDAGVGASLAGKLSGLKKPSFADLLDPSRGSADDASARKKVRGPVVYLDGDQLARPLDMPKKVRLGLIGALVVAALIGAAFLSWYFDGIVNEPKRQQEALAETLSQEVSYELPNLYSLMPLDDATILSTLQGSGLTIIERPQKKGRSLYELIRLPEGLNVVDAGAMYLSGVDNLSAGDAARLLNGGWDLQIDRENGVNMVLHYADFKATSVDAAVQSALAIEGLTETSIEESGEDSAGNTYVMGTITGDAGTFSWRVSALPLSEVYSISGLPESAVYVGIRMTS